MLLNNVNWRVSYVILCNFAYHNYVMLVIYPYFL